ncbi:aldo/keto reductase [Kitasatospora herbaricolor]|uniref:aldo/keto reductase n=1 Tax=Kitasatospora herbaricolor TaxID=68217 RepID=UPI0036DDF968
MRHRRLGTTDLTVSELAFGASPLGSVFGPFAAQDGIDAVRTALDLGINFFDVAPYYGAGAAETLLGRALRGVDRGSYLLATKAGRYGATDFDFSARQVRRSVTESLRRLGTDHLDLIQCHDIEFAPPDQIVEETLPALRRLQDQGLVRHVGITGYPLPLLGDVTARARVDTVLSYGQYTLHDRRLATWTDRFAARGTGVVNASPLAMGALTRPGPPDWHPGSAGLLRRCAEAADLCEAAGGDLAGLALQFSARAPGAATTVVGTSSPEEVRRNVRRLAEPVDEELLARVEACLAPVRDQGWTSGPTPDTGDLTDPADRTDHTDRTDREGP